VEAAARVGGRAVNWEDGLGQLAAVDIVVSCTGAAHLILDKKQIASTLRGRRRGPLFLIDIAVPRDIDPAANELDNVYLYDIDGLQDVVEANLEERQAAAERAGRVIARDVQAFDRWRQAQRMTPIIVALRESLLEMGRQEVRRHRRKLGPLEPHQERAVEELTRSVIQKILHRPVRHLRGSVERGDTHQIAAIYRQIFGLDAESPLPEPKREEPDDDASEAAPPGPHRLGKTERRCAGSCWAREAAHWPCGRPTTWNACCGRPSPGWTWSSASSAPRAISSNTLPWCREIGASSSGASSRR
jgi:glutamyl-tRNA reductase